MTRRLVLWIVATFILSNALVVGLWGLSKDIREQPGSFLRQYPPHPVLESKLIKLDDDHYYFAGATKQHIYLANTMKPFEILKITSDLSDTSLARIDLGLTENLKFFRITVRIDSPYFYFMDGAIPYIYRGDISNWRGERFMKDSTYFIDAIPISLCSFAVCSFSPKTKEKVLGKISISINSNHTKLNYDLLERQFDGLFDVDGSLAYDRELNKLVYVYYYRNQFLVMDTDLNLDYRGNTIDTFRTAQVKTAEVSSENTLRLSAPPIITNKSHAVYQEWLFVHSLLPAKNENMKHFDRASTIDVYNLNSGIYEFSFYAFDEYGEKMKAFNVVNRKLYVLYKHAVRSFDLTERYFPNQITYDLLKKTFFPVKNQE